MAGMDLTRFARVAGTGAVEVDGDLVVVSPLDLRCFSLNATAAAVWAVLPVADGELLTLAAIVDVLTETYRVDRAVCEADVTRLLGAMTDAGVVSTTD